MFANAVALVVIGQSAGLFSQVVPRPTGQNGYEEYVRAAELVNSDPLVRRLSYDEHNALERARASVSALEGLLQRATPEQREEIAEELKGARTAVVALAPIEGMSPLAVRRLLVERTAKVWSLVEAGNAKPIFDPRRNYSLETLFPEYAHFKMLVRIATARVEVQLADGDGSGAVRTLTHAYTFADRIGSFTLIGRLVSIACSSILNAALEQWLPLLPERGVDRLTQAIGACLAGEPGLIRVMEQERVIMREAARAIAENPDMSMMLMVFDDEKDPAGLAKEHATIRRLRSATPTQRTQILDAAFQVASRRLDQVVRQLRQPESQWFNQVGGPVAGDRDVETIAGSLHPFSDGAVSAEAKYRTQLRLARAALRIHAYRWRTGKLPAKAEEVIASEEWLDPLAGSVLRYEPLAAGGFRVYSVGNAQTGEIALRWRRPQTVSGAIRP
jgi:hypothetical protein